MTGPYASSLSQAVNNLNSDLSQYAQLQNSLSEWSGLGQNYTNIRVFCNNWNSPTYSINGDQIPINFGFYFRNTWGRKLDFPLTVKIKFTRARLNTDSVQKFYNNKNNSKQWSEENDDKCNFFNFGIQQVQQDTWTDISVRERIPYFQKNKLEL